VSPNKREREYARRRYEKWQREKAHREQNLRQARRNAYTAIGAVVGVFAAVGIGFYVFSNRTNTRVTSAAAAAGSASASAAGSTSAATSGTPAASACPAPPAAPSATPASWPTAPDKSLAGGKTWTWKIETNCGAVTAALDGAKAPQAVASTIFLAQKGFWDKTPCHRLTVEGIFVLQCGDPTGTGTGGPGYSYGPVENAPATNIYPAGTVAMARQGGNGSSMGSQFFLVYQDSTIPSDAGGGYTVLGRITAGLDTVTKVASGGLVPGDPARPLNAVSILSTIVTAG
jgi:peptidyl-prolyl cis-trans isomerase B (cyclophilin B)